jgi:hypothetical protein
LTRVCLSHHIVESLKNTSFERTEHDNFSSSDLSQNQTKSITLWDRDKFMERRPDKIMKFNSQTNLILKGGKAMKKKTQVKLG